MRVIIIDDEQPARDLVKVFLQDFGYIEVVGEADNGFEGAKLVNDLKPDLIFLDIQMPKIDGFEMLELLEQVPQVIFCTAFDQYAIRAFDKKAADYLLKPFSRQRFAEALEKINSAGTVSEPKVMPQVADYQKPLDRIVVKDRKEIIIIDVEEIDYLEAQDDYVEIHTAKGQWLKQQTMKYFETSLEGSKFCRVHRKYIIRVDGLSKLDKLGKETYNALLKNGQSIPVSQSGYIRLKDLLGI
jgi:two-component system LytT family response regulator